MWTEIVRYQGQQKYRCKGFAKEEGELYKMTIYICDDSRSDLLRLHHHLQEYLSHLDRKIMIEAFSSGKELLQRYEETLDKPSLIFLDIYMDAPDGMSVAHMLREKHYNGGLIFTTSSLTHAMDSYNVDALYYLQKPYDHEDFMNAIRRCRSIFENSSKLYRVNVQGKEVQIPLKDILYFEAGRHVTLIHTLTDTISVTKVLSGVCEDFEQNPEFIKVGRSYLVNRLYVRNVTQTDIEMMNSVIIPIPVRLQREIRQQLTSEKFSKK